jgi:hypothetical protein
MAIHPTHAFQAKIQLARMALQDPRRFVATFEGEGGHAYLRDLWDALGRSYPADERLPSDGAAIARYGDVLLLWLPAPRGQNEAYCMALAGARVFLLEKGRTPPDPPSSAWIAELSAEGRANYGLVSECTAAVFVARIAELTSAGRNPCSPTAT